MRQAFVVEEPRHAALRALNYEPAVERLRRPRRGRTSTRLRDLVSDLGSGYATVFARLDCDRAHGVELLSQSDMFGAEPEGRVIRVDSMQRPERHLVKKWHVLIAGAGTLAPTELYGRAIIADERLVGKYVGQDTLRIEFADPEGDEALFAYAYLASPTGLRALRSTSYGTKILRIRRDVLAELPVPHVDDKTRARVAHLVRRTVEMRETYLRELRAARSVVESLPEMIEAKLMCAERKARSVAWSGRMPTLGAWNFASPGGALAFLERKWSGRLGDVLADKGLFYGVRSARISCEAPYGIDFVSQRNAFLIRPTSRRVLLPGVPNEMVLVPEGAIVVAARGTLGEGELFGRPALVAGVLTRLGLTEDLLRLVPKPEGSALTYAFLSTLVGLRLVRSTAVGTKILNLRFDLLRALPFPSLSSPLQRQVDAHVRSAREARASAEDAESEAIRIIEEEVMPAWLD